jgi:hypothetical protein
MIQMLFFLRYKTQLRRTRPDLIKHLEESLGAAGEASGGVVRNERRLLSVSFDETGLGSCLDLLIALESFISILEKAAPELYGYSLVIGPDVSEIQWEKLCRLLSMETGGGVWFGPGAQRSLSPYIYFERKEPGRTGRIKFPKDPALRSSYVRFKGIRDFRESPPGAFPFRETIFRALKQGSLKNTLILGPAFSGKRDGIYRYCAGLSGNFPPLIIRFGPGGGGLNAFTDAWSPRIRSTLEDRLPAQVRDELDSLEKLLFRERLRDEISDYILKKGRRFFVLLLESYVAEAERQKISPLLILENVLRAEQIPAGLCLEVLNGFIAKNRIWICGTCSADNPEDASGGDAGDIESGLKLWEGIFPRLIRLNAESCAPPETGSLPLDLWEIAYAFFLLSRYFPGALFQTLLEEEGKNPAMILRALSLLASFGIIDCAEDPRPRIPGFAAQAERILGERKEKIRSLVRNRLLEWVTKQRLRPCFRLLIAAAELGGPVSLEEKSADELILKSIAADCINGTVRDIESARALGNLAAITGARRAAAVWYIHGTMNTLLRGNGEQIRAVFRESPPEEALYVPYRPLILANLTSYYLGIRDLSSALETVKEAMLMSQDKPWSGLAQSYRLFALVNLARHQISETLDYMGFAVENAERYGNFDELGVSSYYAAAAQFLYGNLSKAERLARQAEEQAGLSDRPDWADRARFLAGKLRFETGRYRDALDVFGGLRKNPASPSSPEKERLLEAWIYRSKIYSQSPLVQKPAGESPDADLFEIEASYLAGNYHKTVELADRLQAALSADQFVYIEQPDWRSGFAQCESLLLSQNELWYRMIPVYRSLALCRLSSSGGAEAVQAMHRIIRDERLSEADPHNAFYLYVWYRVLQDSGAAQVDMNTAVSMAFKRLQGRASRIDDVETRRNYLSLPRWNAALSQAAKDYKLI